MVGGGWGPASANAGSSYTHSESSNEGRIAMIDINGDAMPDKVWKGRDGKLHYRLNMNKDLLHPYFGEARELKGVNSFSKGSTVSHSFDANIGTGFGPISAGFAVSRTIDESKTKIYFQDFNADGLIDIAQNGTVFFNHSDGLNVVFDNKSTNTGNPIVGHAAAIDETFIPDYDAIRDSLERAFPMNDAVRLWRAPYSGTVQVTGTTQKLSSAGDGVGLSIQHNNTVLWHHDHLQSGTLAVPTQTVTVNQGDYLLFRVNAIYSGIGDAVKWDPAIVYTSIAADTYAGEDLKHYKSSQDYIGGESSTAALDINGTVTYDGIYNKQKTSDDVLLAVIKTDKTGRETQIDSLFLPADTIISNGNFSGSYNSVVADSATVDFVIKTTSPINWKHISWAPVFHRDTVNYTLAPKHLMYNKNIVAKADTLVHITTTPDSIWSKELFLVPDFQVNRMSDKDTGEASVYLTVKGDDGSLIYKRTLKLANSNKIQTDTIPVKKPQLISKLLNGKLQVTYSVINELKDATVARLHLYRDSIVMTLGADGKMHPSDTIRVKLATLPASVYSSFNRLDYGLLYKGWGQFGWNGNKKDEAIHVEDMKVSEGNEYIKNGKINTEAVEKNTLDISKQKFFTMGYLPLYKWYRSATDSTYVGASMLRPSRLGVDEIVIDSIKYNTDGDGLPAPVLVSKSKGWGKTFSAGFSWGISLGVNKSNSTQDSYTIVSAMDMNGDSYPDWLNENNGKVKVQLTKPIGTLGENIRYHVENNKFYGEASNEGSNAGLSMDPKAYKLDKFNEELRTAKNAVTKAREALAINPRTKIDAGNASFSGNVSEKSCGASGNFSSGASGAVRNWEDLNGDGLPDMLMKGQVRYNLGYGFTEAIASGTEKMEESWNNNYGSGLGICIPVLGTFSISGGQNGTASLTSSKTTFKDINGDGLPDLIEQNMLGDLKVTLNMGNG
ncbi:MAG: type IV secretion protein Rhs, partial [Megasphaera micronuciformis]|nr:type IV secretion protein Rhs [Megasphaera micronuciformis]